MSLHKVLASSSGVLIIGLAVALVAYASQTAQMTSHRDSPIAVILFGATSILLFTLPRIGGNSRIPHIFVIIFGLTTILAFLLGMVVPVKQTKYVDVIRNDCNFGVLIGKPPNLPSDPALCHKAVVTWWLDLALLSGPVFSVLIFSIWVKIVLVWNIWNARHAVESTEPLEGTDSEHRPLLVD